MPVSRLRLALILGGLVAFGPLSVDMYLPAFPALGQYFAADPAAVQRTLAAYLLGIASGQVVYGPLSDAYGRKRPLYLGIALFVVGSLACALAPSIEALAGLRLVQALGGCAGMVMGRAIVRDVYSGAEAAKFFSVLMLVIGVAPILGPLLGGQVQAMVGWQAIFLILAAFGLAVLLAVALLLPETLPVERRRTGGLAEALRSYRALLGDRRFMGLAMAGGLSFAGMFGYMATSPFVFMELNGLSPAAYGVLFGSNALGFVLAAQVNGALVGRVPLRRVLLCGMGLQLGASAALLVTASTGLFGLAGLVVPLFLAIASLGLIMPNAFALAMQPHPGIAGAASALAGTLQFAFGASIGAAVGAIPAAGAMPMALCFAGASLLAAGALALAR